MLARSYPWLIGYLVASMLASISWLQHWSFGCSAARLDTFAGCAAARSILGRLWTHYCTLYLDVTSKPPISSATTPVVAPAVGVSLRLTCKVLLIFFIFSADSSCDPGCDPGCWSFSSPHLQGSPISPLDSDCNPGCCRSFPSPPQGSPTVCSSFGLLLPVREGLGCPTTSQRHFYVPCSLARCMQA
jgi:hypothetical protein